MSRSRPSRNEPRRAGGGLRAALLVALVLLVALIALRFPVVPAEEWPRPHRFQPDDEACEEERTARQWTWLEVTEEEGYDSVADVARKLQLEVPWICRANGRDPGCGPDRLLPGDTLVLPLAEEAVEAARQAKREGRPATAEGLRGGRG